MNHRTAIAYILEQLGVRTQDGEPPSIAADLDRFDFRIVLPHYRERVQLDALVLVGNPAAAVDVLQAARDRLFRKAIEHMGKHMGKHSSITEQFDHARLRAELAEILSRSTT